MHRPVECTAGILGSKVETPSAAFLALKLEDVPDEATCTKIRSKFSLQASLNEHILNRPEAKDATPAALFATAMAMFGVLYGKWRNAQSDEAWRDTRIKAGVELCAPSTLPLLDEWFHEATTWQQVARTFINAVVTHHDRVLFGKGNLEACWLRSDGDRIIRDQDYQPRFPPHSSRTSQAMNILRDLCLVELSRSDGYTVTAAGKSVMQQAWSASK